MEIVFSLGLLATTTAFLLAALPLALKNSADAGRVEMSAAVAESWLAEISAFGKLREMGEIATPLVGGGEVVKFVALDDKGKIIRTVGMVEFTNGEPSAVFIAYVYLANRGGLTELEISVEWPAGAPQHPRNRQFFATPLPP
jgi:hypothetical protein